MSIKEITVENREKIVSFFKAHWGSPEMVISTGIYQCDTLNGLIFEENNQIIGLVTYVIKDDEIEVISLDSLQEGKGIGTSLMKKIENIAKQKKLQVVSLVTTNDNLNALKFYQKRGYRITTIIPNGVNKARNLKPSIPLIGNEGIPLNDELILKKIL
ncbi:GNAT family N-acetyltransferase [Psychrobacillus sp. NEAU-3TGS]|uniref:GNAT family N-acetyltransferase n=1 Tax=Psychrobacillus sp. NEAU-3TGS TaxID=2995412 RepID=UPI00249873CE|nr:GNAT family N-acetyltransferase [Psychrobacillus sp. NEAU-3TGS]MDI2586221.1 GNAT family N-acetyltransferase [Psychrobacillus sp. NEAU-3TGS]